MRTSVSAVVVAGCVALMGMGCQETVPTGSLVVTQVPAHAAPGGDGDVLDGRYPTGSRVVLVAPSGQPGSERVLSKGLVAAGGPVLTPDARTAFFAGKADAKGEWQIYAVPTAGGRPKAVTAMSGGAMDPAIAAHGELVFASPVPKAGQTWKTATPAALYTQKPGNPARRVSFGPTSAVEPTVLADGRVMFVSQVPDSAVDGQPHTALFTINNDGTEVTAYAGQHDGVAYVHRPRELGDGRIGFVGSRSDAPADDSVAETVRTARPFASRGPLFPFPLARCRSVEPGGSGSLLACVESRGMADRSMKGSYGVYEVAAGATALDKPLFDAPEWQEVEALRVAPRPEPLGHVTAVMTERKSGTILCLNANFSTYTPAPGQPAVPAVKVRVLAQSEPGKTTTLGEVPVQADGSLMAEVPVDTPLGFEALDDQGKVVRRLAPFVWVRPGENRSCLGCHEPHNRSPKNVRPLAIHAEIAKLGSRSAP